MATSVSERDRQRAERFEAQEAEANRRAGRGYERGRRRELRSLDDEHQRAYEAGKAGRHYAPPAALVDHADELEGSYSFGDEERRGDEARGSRMVRPLDSFSRRPVKLSDEAGGAVVGLVAFCLGINYLRHGWSGVVGWLGAKFVNKPMGAPGASLMQPPTGQVGQPPAGKPGPAPKSPGTFEGPSQGAPGGNFPTTTPTPVM